MLRRALALAACAWAMLLTPGAAPAAVLMIVEQHSPFRVAVRSSGSLDLTGLGPAETRPLDLADDPLMVPNRGYLASGVGYAADYYRAVFTNPAPSLGPGGPAPWWSVANDQFFAFDGSANEIALPVGYVSGREIASYTEYAGEPGWSLDLLGITPGRKVFDLVNGERVVVVVSPVPVPLPAALPLALAGIGALAALRFGARTPA